MWRHISHHSLPQTWPEGLEMQEWADAMLWVNWTQGLHANTGNSYQSPEPGGPVSCAAMQNSMPSPVTAQLELPGILSRASEIKKAQ